MLRPSPLARVRTMPKRSRNADMVKALDVLCRAVVMLRDDHKCQKCGSTRNIQWSHVYTRNIRSLRWEMDNSLALCSGCHLWWHDRPLDSGAWFKAIHPDRAKRLSSRLQYKQKVDSEAIRIFLEQEYDVLSRRVSG